MNLALKKILLIVTSALLFSNTYSQLTGIGCAGYSEYTDGSPGDSIYYLPAGALGSLTATPESGIAGWNFTWSVFHTGSSSWSFFSSQSGVPTSTITNLDPGAYSVTITDGTGETVGCYIAWIVNVLSEANVDIAPIPANCNGPVQLNGTINYGSASGYSNLPSTQMLVDAGTEVSVCFTGNHTWVSDLAFYLVGPASCGSPTLLLSPNPGAIGQPTVCNSGDNITNLCFSTESVNNLNVCSGGAFTLAGTYGSYGPSATPIAWSGIYGCDANSSGWAVQIYDCIGLDTGSLTDATISFTGQDNCGSPQTISYSTPPGYSSPINDNSCSASTASIFSVPASPAAPLITCDYGYEWNSEPYVYIADSTTSLNITLTELIDASGNVMPWQPVLFTLSLTSSCDSLIGEDLVEGDGIVGSACFGGNSYDQEMYNIIPLQEVNISPLNIICQYDDPQTLIADIPGGVWSGPGITDPVAGIFDPAVSGIGSFDVLYEIENPCIDPGMVTITVAAEPLINLDVPVGVCIDGDEIDLGTMNAPGGIWTGNGITSDTGIFDPQAAGFGTHTIQASYSGVCPVTVNASIDVYALPVVNAGPDQQVCGGSITQLNATGAATYHWSPATALSNVNIFNPTSNTSLPIIYTVTGTSINGCTDTDEIALTIFPLPTVEAEQLEEEVCPGTTVSLNATGSPGSYAWTPAAGVSNASSNEATVAPTLSGTYTITLTDACGAMVQDVMQVDVEAIYTVSAGDDTAFCEGETALLHAEITGEFPSIQWTTTDGYIGTGGDNTDLLIADQGNYFVTVTTPLGCTYNDHVFADKISLPDLNIPSELDICPGGNIELNAGEAWDAVAWSTGQTSPSIIVDAQGEYNVTVTDNGCSSSGTINVTQVFLPYVELGPDIEICAGDVAVLSVPLNAYWSTGANNDEITVSNAGTYGVTVHIGPCVVSDSIQVVVDPMPYLELGPPITGCIDQAVAVSAYHPNNERYVWSTGDTTSFISVITPGLYSAVAYNQCGLVEDFVEVSFEDCSFSIFIPNSFTPDNDGVNDVWKISTFNMKSVELEIFNRWGDVIFTSSDPFAVWTGDVHEGAHFAPDGIYMYRLTFLTNNDEVGERNGSIIVLR